jgi:hypothetical protein
MGSEKFMIDDVKVIGTSESWMYLSNTKSFAYELFENWIAFFLYYIPVMMIISYFASNAKAMIGIALFLPIVLMMFIRRKVDNLWRYIGCNLLVIAAVFFISPSGVEKVFFTLVMLGYFIYSFKKRYAKAVSFLHFYDLLLSGGLLTVYYLVASYINIDFAKSFIMVVSFNTVICLAIYLHLVKTQKLMEWETSYAATFINRVKKMKIFTVVLLVAAIGILNLVLWKSGMYALFDYFQDSIANFFHFSDGPKTPQFEEPKKMGKSVDEAMIDALRTQGDNSNIFFIILGKILVIFLDVTMIVILIYVSWVVFLKLKELYKYLYYREERSTEKRELVLPTENISASVVNRIKSVRENVEDIFEKSNRKKIRKIYNKLIIKNKNKGIKLSLAHTPVELQEKIQDSTKQNLEEATIIYEKARYSTKECSDEEVAKIKKLI